MERVSWKDKKTNDGVLYLVGEGRSIIQTIVRRKKNWIGHVVRGDGLLKLALEGRMEGRRTRGRPRRGTIDELKIGSYAEMKRRAQNRELWTGWMP